MKKILITATVQSHICQFHLPLIKKLKEKGYCVDVAAKNNLDLKPGLSLEGADIVYDVPFSRSPMSTDNLKAYKELKKIIDKNNYDVIYCNTPMGSVVTRLAAKKQRKFGAKVIYTAHGFHFFDGASKKNWMIYYPVEKLMARLTDVLITINKEDYERAKRKFDIPQIEYIHGVGFDKNRFSDLSESIREGIRKKFSIPQNAKVMISVGELNDNKNQISVIEAMKKINDKNLYYIVCGNGANEKKLKSTAQAYGLEKNVVFPGYRRDLNVLFMAADIFIHSSYREGLPLSVLEAMSAGLKAVCSDIRGIRDIIIDGENGLLINPKSVDDIADKIKKAYDWNPNTESVDKITELYSSENAVSEVIKIFEGVR